LREAGNTTTQSEFHARFAVERVKLRQDCGIMDIERRAAAELSTEEQAAIHAWIAQARSMLGVNTPRGNNNPKE